MPFNPDFSSRLDRSIVLVGLMGAGKTAIGKRLAAHLNLPFFDVDQEIERAAGLTVSEIFAIHGEAHFRAGEKRVIRRLLSNGRVVLSPGGGAFIDPQTRAIIRERAISIWLRCPLPILVQRVQVRAHRPLLNAGDPAEILRRLSEERSPVYALADIIVDGSEDPPNVTTKNVLNAMASYGETRRVAVELSRHRYDVLIGERLIANAGAQMRRVIPQPRCIIITDENVARVHLQTLNISLDEAGVHHSEIVVPPGEPSKTFRVWQRVVETLLERRVDRSTTVIALGGGVIGDLAGFAAATTLRGLPLIQIPTTLLAQVDSSVGGKTGINSTQGKNLVGAFHQPILVLADIGVISTLPVRERCAGYSEIVKAGLIADAGFYEWCESHGRAMLEGDASLLMEAVERSVRFKANVVSRDELETQPVDGRALLNLGHTFAHALETETGYGSALLHGEAVAVGLVLATEMSARLGYCPKEDAPRIASHLQAVGLPVRIEGLRVDRLLGHMKQDKKMRDGVLTFVLTRGIGQAFTCPNVTETVVREALLAVGAID